MNINLVKPLFCMIMDLPWLLSFELGSHHYVFPSQCEQVFYSEVPGRVGWSFVVRYDPRGRPLKHNVAE